MVAKRATGGLNARAAKTGVLRTNCIFNFQTARAVASLANVAHRPASLIAGVFHRPRNSQARGAAFIFFSLKHEGGERRFRRNVLVGHLWEVPRAV